MKSKYLIAALALMAGGSLTASAVRPPEPVPQSQSSATITASGTIIDSEGEPVIGASIIPEGQNTGVTTDIDGKFNIVVKPGTKLRISYIGHKTVTLPATTGMNITLEPENSLLDEVVVMGYGTQKKKLVTGATVQVKGDDIARQNTVNPLGALQTQSPGVNITQSNGFIGQGFKVNIRGIGTIGSSEPLIVVDGVANGSLDNLNPSDIESIDVLKDAASAAIYGARAANGVILVTTKQGREGQSTISYDGYVGVQNIYKMPHLLDAQEFMAIQDEGRVMDGLAPYNWGTYIPQADLNAIAAGTWKGTNWLDEVRNKDAVLTNHALNFTGGDATGNYSIGLAYTYQEATMGVPDAMPTMNRYNARINSQKVVKRLNGHDFITIGETVNYKYQEIDGSFATGGIYWNGIHNMLVMSPLMHAYNANGDYYMEKDRVADGYNWDISNGANKNPIAYLDYQMNQNRSKSHYLQSSIYLQIEPIERLKFRTLFGYIFAGSSYRSYTPVHEITSYIHNDVDDVSQSLNMSSRWSWENTLNYTWKIGKNDFDVLLGQSIEKWGYNSDSLSATMEGSNFSDLAHAYLSNVPFNASSVTAVSGAPGSQGTLASFFGRINYNYDEKYMASFIMRADGSSVFARGHRWGYFPSVSAGWVMSNEDFMEGARQWLDFLKIRGSWGQNGNCAVSTFQYLSLIASNNNWGGYSFGDKVDFVDTGSYAYKLTNPDLKWETQEQLDFGFDARLLRSRLGVAFDWYRRTTKDWLVTAPVLGGYGADAPAVNGGNIINTGVELGLTWNDAVGRDFNYSASFNLAYNKNKVTKIANEDGIIHGPGSVLWEGAEECYRAAEVGQPVGYFFGYKSAGIFQNQAEIDAYQGAFINGREKAQPGDVIWVDTNNDGVIDAKDRTNLGSPHPKITMGINFSAQWRMLDFSINGYAALGQKVMKCYRDFVASPLQNFTSDILDRWHGEGTSNTLPRLTSSTSSNWNRVSDLYVEDGDYFKIKNITLGLDFKKVFPKIPFGQLRLYASVQNVYTFTKYSGMDPEIGFGGENAGSYAQGIDLGYYPSSRNILFGINIKY